MEDGRAEWPDPAELEAAGLDPGGITCLERIHRKHGSVLFRVVHQGRSLVLKWYPEPGATEVRAYELLARQGVPLLPLHGKGERLLLLEDLNASPEWRLATAADIEHARTGAAVAEWYRALHAAGRRVLSEPGGVPAFLTRESDALNGPGILAMGERLGLAGNPVWRLAATHVEALKAAQRALSETLSYNDFHWTNLALSRGLPPRAIVFDYHLLGIGNAWCDIRNVLGSLGPEAAAAFQEAYGPVDPREAILDAPLSTLYSLHVALQLPRFPGWAEGCLRSAHEGGLKVDLHRAMEMLGPCGTPAAYRPTC